MSKQKLAIHGGTPARSPHTAYGGFGMTAIDEQEEAAVLEVMRAKRLHRFDGANPEESSTSRLENNFATYTATKHALAVNSGTAALIVAYQGLGVGPGDEVIVPAYTWMSTASAAMALGAVPVIAEVDESLTLEPADVEAKITPYTKAITAVHMRGTQSRMDELQAIAQQYQRAYMYHDVTGGQRHNLPESEMVWGINFRIAEVLAAIALVQLIRLDGLVEQLQARKQMLKTGMESAIASRGMSFREVPDPAGDTGSTLTFFAATSEKAQTMQAALQAENIRAGLLYRSDRSDYHVYAHWAGVMNKRTWTPDGGPWRWAKREMNYHPEMCPRSLDLLGRSISLNVDLNWTNEDIEETLDGITRVIDQLG